MTEGSSAGELRFEVLGPIRAFRGDQPIDLGPPSRRAVLAALLLQPGRPVPLERIVAALWDGDPPENGADVVLRCIGELRRTLDPERTSLLALTDGGYVLRVGEEAVDAGRFRASLAQARAEHQTGNVDTATGAVHRALELWQAEPLTGMTGSIFEAAKARLKQDRATASQLLAAPDPARAATANPGATGNPVTPTRFSASASVPASAPASASPAPAAADPAPSRPAAAEPQTKPAAAEPSPAKPATAEPPAKPDYPDAVDPWDGHDLFPPDPMSIL
ncbi:hypothetical protein BJY16_006446 [Actinoplanes octamycinicus]|uniref:OmpR/PhoB-type domain-containing protein n=1 Tax=Actinoplanes octamycinicus TaxID=135948 RepID=A0A7W7H3I7_9ACTN|nr:winged helix-turn-helix domain-containing protein [Actinoplanes octamycinicus]MBB4742987.1 hypothetical protein [Actinoplanes octamycinicus]GIE58159.1 hypothetical protein Aoc01nite_35610 [Actinoplanes octamycinicus]